MSAKPDSEEAAKAPVKSTKSKKLLIIVVAAVTLVALIAGGAFFYISKQRAAAEAEEADGASSEKVSAHSSEPKKPPAYLPLDNMVVNLADPGGEKVAQIGITLEVTDAHAADAVKAFLPTIRSGILLLISQRTAEELLKPEGKQQLAKDILRETSIPFGGGADVAHGEELVPPKKSKKSASKSDHAAMPVVGVLFSSFIVQ